MTKTFDFTTEIPDNRKIHIIFPDDIPVGRAKLHIVVVPQESSEVSTLGDLLHSEFFGMWRDRTDIADSMSFARELREKAWSRQS